jgi:hypothetical protein
MNDHLKVVMTEMCSRVGVELKKVDFGSAGWFRKHTWSREQEDDFVNWLANYVYSDSEARKQPTTIRIKTRDKCKRFAKSFVFQYGWKVQVD